MRVAYIILAHRLPDQLVRLVRRLQTPNACFLIHLDRRSDDGVLEAARRGLADLDNAWFIRRHKVFWGGFGHVQAALEGLDELSRRGLAFDYATLLTGQDYPIKPAWLIERTLAEAAGRSFVAHQPIPRPDWIDGEQRIAHWHSRRIGVARGRHLHVPLRRRLPYDLEAYGGSAYWWLQREAVDYMRQWIAEHPRIVPFFKHVDNPDEIFFHTILINSPLRDTVVNDELRYVDWSRYPPPATFSVDDFETLRRVPCLMARKFDTTVDADILDLIDSELLTARDPSQS